MSKLYEIVCTAQKWAEEREGTVCPSPLDGQNPPMGKLGLYRVPAAYR